MTKAKQPQIYLPINGALVPVEAADPSDPTTHPPGSRVVVDHEGVLGEDDALGFALPVGYELPDKPRFDKPITIFESP